MINNLSDAPLASTSFFVLLLCSAVALIDGVDVLSISYTADSLSKQFGWGPAQIGTLLSAGLAGMTIGSLFMSPLADVVGRKASILICLAVITVGMASSPLTHSFWQLASSRLVTGIGIGAITSNIIALVFEYAPEDRRTFALGILGTGFPLGAALAGSAANWLTNSYGWKSIFIVDATLSALLLPLLALWLPESRVFMARRRENANVRRVGPGSSAHSRPPMEIRGGLQLTRTVFVWALVYLLFMASFYFMLTWQAKLLVQMGLTTGDGIRFSTLVTYGGVLGNLTAGFLTRRLGARACAIGMIIVMSALMGLLPWLVHTQYIDLFAVSLGWTMFSSVVILYTLTSGAFPVALRSSCLGVALGVGRIGSILGPYVAGLLLQAGFAADSLCRLLAGPAVAAAIVLTILKTRAVPLPAILLDIPHT